VTPARAQEVAANQSAATGQCFASDSAAGEAAPDVRSAGGLGAAKSRVRAQGACTPPAKHAHRGWRVLSPGWSDAGHGPRGHDTVQPCSLACTCRSRLQQALAWRAMRAHTPACAARPRRKKRSGGERRHSKSGTWTCKKTSSSSASSCRWAPARHLPSAAPMLQAVRARALHVSQAASLLGRRAAAAGAQLLAWRGSSPHGSASWVHDLTGRAHAVRAAGQ
jgi:hypothetical protein